MQIKKSLLVSAAVLSLASSLTTGCKTVSTTTVPTPGGTNLTSTVSVPDVPQMVTIAKSAAYIGSAVWLNGIPPKFPAHPRDVQKIITVRNSLRALVASATFSSADLVTALKGLPFDELKSDTGTVAIGEAVILWDQYGRQLAALDKAQVVNTYLVPVATALADGLSMTVGP